MSGEWRVRPLRVRRGACGTARISVEAISRGPTGLRTTRGGMTRRELARQGRRRCGGGRRPGSVRRPGRGGFQRRRRERQVHRHAAGAQPRRRVPDPGHREAGLEGPRLHGEADPRTVREAAADRDHAAGHVRRLRRLQLPVAAGLAVRRPPAARHAQAHAAGTPLQAVHARQAQPGVGKRCTFGQGNAPFRTTFVDPDGSTGLPRYASGPASNKQIVRWIGENGKPIGGKPQPRWIVGPAAHFNADSMGYNADVIKKRPEQVSWAELLNTKWKGRVVAPPRPGHHEPGRGAPPSRRSACSSSRTSATRRRPRSTGSSRSSPRTRSRASSVPSGRRSPTRSTSWSRRRS